MPYEVAKYGTVVQIRKAAKGKNMIDQEILKHCQIETDECLLKAGHQEKLLKKLKETGGYDSFTLLEAISTISELRQQLSGIQKQLLELSNSTKTR
jgi:hypothetical protein